jgi:hypothetical protein
MLYVGKKTISVDCEGEVLTLEITPLNVLEYQKALKIMQPLIAELPEDGAEPKEDKNLISLGLDRLSNPEFAELIIKLVPKHCSNLQGILINDGTQERAVTINDLITHGIFLPTLLNIFLALFNFSSLSSKEEELLKKQ